MFFWRIASLASTSWRRGKNVQSRSAGTDDSQRWGVAELIVLDYYDGPREGLCKLAIPAGEFSFKMIAERYNPDGLDDRFYRLSSLPPGSVDKLPA